MRKLFKYRNLLVFTCLVLGLFIAKPVYSAQEESDEDLKKKYVAILGEYEFYMEGGTFILNFYVEDGALWADSGDERPATMEPVEDKQFEFTAEDPEAGIFEIKFLKDDEGEYTICHIVNAGMGLDMKGNKIK
ncbi:MAG: hypothetical protein HQ555_03720 [Candidatus Aminicenantes bacterium]|nr:hypothetical protein [Candidatus Aminicenantes bacterium]